MKWPRDVGGMERFAVLAGEDPTGVHPATSPLLAVFVLLDAVPLQGLDRIGIQRDGACACIGLGVVLVHLPAVHDELLGNGDQPGVQVRVGPLLPACLAAPQTAEGDQMEQRVQPVSRYLIEE